VRRLSALPWPGRRLTYRIAAASAAVLAVATVVAACTGPTPRPGPDTVAAPPAATATVAVTARVDVDAAAERGAFNNPADYENQADHSLALGPRDLTLARALRPTVMRAWITPRRFYDATTDTYDFDYPSPSSNSLYDYLDQVSGLAPELFVNVNQCARELMTLADPQQCRDALKRGLSHYKQRYPKLRYIELFNEPDMDWEPEAGGPGPMPVEDYYRWYQIGYSIINEINAELRPATPLRIGGPVTYTFDEPYLKRFLDLYAADTDPAKRLDFISYHQYKARANPATVATEKAKIAEWLGSHGLPRTVPVFVTEYGVFPGDNKGTSFAADQLTQAAAMQTLGNFFTEGATDMAMHWVFDHPTNDRKSMFVDRRDGAVTPYYNLVAMQRMLRGTWLTAHSDALSVEGIGVNAMATKDSGAVAVLVTNYQWINGKTTHGVRLDVANLPESFQGRPVHLDRYLIDARTSNYAADRAHPGLTRVERATLPAGNGAATTFTLTPNAMSLVVLTPG
jgi:hypothetical protein